MHHLNLKNIKEHFSFKWKINRTEYLSSLISWILVFNFGLFFVTLFFLLLIPDSDYGKEFIFFYLSIWMFSVLANGYKRYKDIFSESFNNMYAGYAIWIVFWISWV